MAEVWQLGRALSQRLVGFFASVDAAARHAGDKARAEAWFAQAIRPSFTWLRALVEASEAQDARDRTKMTAHSLAALAADLAHRRRDDFDHVIAEARGWRGDSGPECSADELAGELRGHRSPLERARRAYNLLAWNANVEPKPDTRRGLRGELAELLKMHLDPQGKTPGPGGIRWPVIRDKKNSA